MSKIFFDCGITLDGFFAGDNRSPSNPMGGVSGKIHQWMFKQKTFWKHIKVDGGGEEDSADGKLIDEHFQEQGPTSWGNGCSRKAKFLGQKICMKQMFMY